MYKNQLQELAQRSCFNLPSYSCIREGPDHAPRFKATVNFNGETFESPNFCTTLRQAEHSAAEVALSSLSNKGPSHSLAARILDETGVYKNLLQEIAQRVGAPLPLYTTFRSGLGHLPVFTGTVELAGIIFTGEPAKNKKQAEKNAAMAAWSSLKQLAKQSSQSSSETENNDEQEQITVARALLNYLLKEKVVHAPSQFPKKFPMQTQRPSGSQPLPVTTSKILPLIRPKSSQRNRPETTCTNESTSSSRSQPTETHRVQPQKFPTMGSAPYIPMRHLRSPYHGVAPQVTIRTAIPVFTSPQLPQPPRRPPLMGPMPVPVHISSPVCIRQAVPVFSAPPVRVVEQPSVLSVPTPPAELLLTSEKPPVLSVLTTPAESLLKSEKPPVFPVAQPAKSPEEMEELTVFPLAAKSSVQTEEPSVSPSPATSPAEVEESRKISEDNLQESLTVEDLKKLKI